MIRKCIEWATNKELWPELWPHSEPNQFWYFYPNYDVATSEFYTKWKLFMPKGSFANDPTYGWSPNIDRKQIKSISFNSGVTVYFKAYSQKVEDIQAGTVYAIFADEEMPLEFLPECQLRMAAVYGYFHMGFTATLGQDYFRRTIQPEGPDEELHPDALKLQISMYDCLTYEDGTPSHWTLEKIRKVEQTCGSKTEVLRRVHGKFVVSGGLKFESFDREKNTTPPHPIPKSWLIYSGVDIGTGGERGHPAAIVFVAVSPDYRRARVFKAWRGDGLLTTVNDILEKYIELRGPMRPIVESYDFASKDFHTVASQRGFSFIGANKKQDIGTDSINALFKNEALKIQRGDSELEKLCVELTSVLKNSNKTMAKDDLVDALRYAIMAISFDWDGIVQDYLEMNSETNILSEKIEIEETETERRMRERMGLVEKNREDYLEAEINGWNELYEP
jgi:hypothetical protein